VTKFSRSLAQWTPETSIIVARETCADAEVQIMQCTLPLGFQSMSILRRSRSGALARRILAVRPPRTTGKDVFTSCKFVCFVSCHVAIASRRWSARCGRPSLRCLVLFFACAPYLDNALAFVKRSDVSDVREARRDVKTEISLPFST
jgi:hypothetical protein